MAELGVTGLVILHVLHMMVLVVVDYVIVGHVLENIIYITVHPLTLLSNHCYISFSLTTTTFTTDSSGVNFLSDGLQKFKWNEMSKDMFRNTLNSSEIFKINSVI